MLFRIYQKDPTDRIMLVGEDYIYLTRVLRLRQGSDFEVIDGTDRVYLYRILSVTKNQLLAEQTQQYLQQQIVEKELIIMQALSRAEKVELVLQKATEIGVSSFMIYQAEKSKNNNWNNQNKFQRWQKVVVSAVCQSRQTRIPRISAFPDLSAALNALSADANLYFADTGEAEIKLSQIDDKKVVLIFGPEAGFGDAEREVLYNRAKAITLGQNILRTETAPIAAAAKLLLP